jgi:hypothetical protein
MESKYVAVVIILMILIVCYGVFAYKEHSGKKETGKKGAKGGRSKNKSKARKGGKKTSKRNKSREVEEPEESDDDGPEETDSAEELYNLVHESLCKGMQQDEFEEVAGELAGGIAFIELKQMYNQCIDKSMDPMQTITVEDYVRVLKKEDADG